MPEGGLPLGSQANLSNAMSCQYQHAKRVPTCSRKPTNTNMVRKNMRDSAARDQDDEQHGAERAVQVVMRDHPVRGVGHAREQHAEREQRVMTDHEPLA